MSADIAAAGGLASNFALAAGLHLAIDAGCIMAFGFSPTAAALGAFGLEY